jgi:stearoyl-CoA desaturase (Delta-9 desaturase)
MTKAERNVNLIAVLLPFVAFLAAVVLLWNSLVGVTDLIAFGVMYLIAGFGVTVGFHRLLTHRAFQMRKPMEYAFAIAGSMSVQGPVIDWVADHRKHHAHTDVEGDPHSPHVQFADGWRGALMGLFHAHMGWLFVNHGRAQRRKYATDLVEDRGMRLISARFHWWVGLGLLAPFVFGLVVSGTNVLWLAIPSLGEAWHHNHHAFPRSARHGLRWWEIDLSAMLINVLEKLGLAWNVTRIAPERQRQKLATNKPEPAA